MQTSATGIDASAPAASRQPSTSAGGLAGWALFEMATQPFYTLILTFLFAPYFANVVIKDPNWGQALWGYAAAAAGVLVAVGSPVLGAIADVKGRRKPWLAIFVLVLAAAMSALWLARPGADTGTVALVLLAFIIATLMAEFCIVFLNAMMPTLVPRDKLGRLSGAGFAAGYAGGLVALFIMAGLIAANPATGKTMLGLDPIIRLDASSREGDRLVGPFSALWLLVFCLPLFLLTPDRAVAAKGATVGDGLRGFLATIRELPRHRDIALFLVARMIFIDGLTAIFTFGGIYGVAVFGWQALEQGLFGIILTLVGAVGAVLGGMLDDRLGAKRVIIGSLVCLMVGAIGILSIDKTHVLFTTTVPAKVAGGAPFSSVGEQVFLAFGMLVAVVAAPVQAASRSLLARLAPAEHMTQFFGLFAFSGKVTAFAAPLAIATLTAVSGSQRVGMAAILAFLFIGLLLMTRVRVR